MSAIAQTLENILGADSVCSWESLDTARQSRIACAIKPEVAIACLVYPNTLEELAEVIACAHTNRWGLLPYGSGSKLHWGGLAVGVQIGVSTARLNRLIDHASGDMTVTAEAGMRLADLQAQLMTAGQFLTVDPAYADVATLGGIVATADTGALRQRYGGIREFLIGLSFVRTDGQPAKAGGRVVKNVAGYDLMKLFTGSYGTLGVISQVTFRLYPLPDSSQTVVLTGEAGAIAQATSALLNSGLTPTALELLAPEFVAQLEVGKGTGLIGRFQSIEISVEKQARQMLELGQTLGLSGVGRVGEDEALLWQQLRSRMEICLPEPQITCKIGVLPSKAVETLTQIAALGPAIALIHAGSGLGWFRCSASVFPQMLLNLRHLCQAQGGFLTILEAPLSVKRKLDVWGYSGSALTVMKQIKQQFDPDHRFSAGRFVGGI